MINRNYVGHCTEYVSFIPDTSASLNRVPQSRYSLPYILAQV